MKKLNISLLLFTFDTSNNSRIGIAKILGVNQQSGLIYLNDKKPFELIINNNEETLKQIVKAMI